MSDTLPPRAPGPVPRPPGRPRGLAQTVRAWLAPDDRPVAPARRAREALDAEWRELWRRRQVVDPGVVPAGVPPRRAGLALSGGGIRSSTFCLGVLQQLAHYRLLRRFDYLSTVSGGGYVGGWWSAWLQRADHDGAVFPDPAGLEADRESSYREHRPDGSLSEGRDPQHHLRLFSNHLTPRKGILSSDLWRAVAILGRNLLLTWITLLPLLLAAVLLGQSYFLLETRAPAGMDASVATVFAGPAGATAEELGARAAHAARPLLVLAAWFALLTLFWLLNSAGSRLLTAVGLTSTIVIVAGVGRGLGWWTGDGGGWLRSPWVALFAVGLAYMVRRYLLNPMVAEQLADWTRRVGRQPLEGWRGWMLDTFVGGVDRDETGLAPEVLRERWRNEIAQRQSLVLVALGVVGFVLAVAGFAHELAWFVVSPRSSLAGRVATAGGWLTVAASVGSTLFTLVRSAPAGGGDASGGPRPLTRVVFAVAPVLFFVTLAMAVATAGHALLARSATDVAAAAPAALTWTLLAAALLCVAFALMELWTDVEPQRRAVVVVAAALLALVALLGVLPPTAALPPALRAAVAGGAVTLAFLLAQLWRRFVRRRRPLPWRSAGLMIVALLACALAWRLGRLPGAGGVDTGRALLVALALAACAVVAVVGLGWTIDPNLVSMHTFYKARLVRAFLAASNPRRHDHEIRQTAPGDDVRLTDLANCDRGAPYHLINTTLNLVGGRDLATGQRLAAPFVLAKHDCGALRTGYRPTADYMDGRLTLGTAVATSGAAVSPNMGAKSVSASLGMLLTLFNIRLGFWAPTPNGPRWRAKQTRLWPFYLLREFLSQTNDLASYCYLTDGGHFDNTGAYALVERGCRYIVLVDCGADPRPCFSDVGDLIRRCRIDFGAEIELDGRPFERGADGMAAAHVVLGRVTYHPRHLRGIDDPQPEQPVGTVVWIKPAMTRGTLADLRQYAIENPEFPQQTTLDQWFDEAQFESYRMLGAHSAAAAFGSAVLPVAGARLPAFPAPQPSLGALSNWAAWLAPSLHRALARHGVTASAVDELQDCLQVLVERHLGTAALEPANATLAPHGLDEAERSVDWIVGEAAAIARADERADVLVPDDLTAALVRRRAPRWPFA